MCVFCSVIASSVPCARKANARLHELSEVLKVKLQQILLQEQNQKVYPVKQNQKGTRPAEMFTTMWTVTRSGIRPVRD